MASKSRWRCTRPNWIDEYKFSDLLAKLRETGVSDIYIMQIETSQILPNALADIIEGYTNGFDSVDTETLHVLSSDANDKVGDAGCEYVHIVYIKGNVIYDLKQPMDGTDHSHIDQGTWDRVIGMYVDLTETVVPQGNIVLDVNATGTVYCTIVAGDTHSITTKCWIPTGYKGMVVELVPSFTIVEAAGPLFADGMNVGVNLNGTVYSRSVVPENIGHAWAEPMPYDLPLDGESYIAMQHSQLDTDATANTGTINVSYLIYK
jgi:hypothetical protein